MPLQLMPATLRKMSAALHQPVQYTLHLDEQHIDINALLGKPLQLHYQGVIYCIQCQRKTNKSFQQGYCFPCYQKLLACNLCVIHPEKCRFYEGVCQSDDWAHAHCGQPHVVYLANSSGLKVGITRASQIPTRWIDQGATQGLIIFTTQNRHQAGLVEVALKAFLADKTHWQTMLKGNNSPLDLITQRDAVLTQAEAAITALMSRFPGEIQIINDAAITEIDYPVSTYPTKIKAFNFDKDAIITGTLTGIKGQYLLLDSGVINLRKFSGYHVELFIG